MSKGITLPLFAFALLTACHGDSSEAPVAQLTPHASAPASAKHGPTPDELTAGMVEAVTVGKSTVPVAVKFDLGARPLVGQPLDIDVAVLPLIAASATLQVTGSDGLQLPPGAAPIEIPSAEPTQVYRHSITIIPTAEGVQLLGLSVSLNHDEITETREFSVPLIVATGP
jgi:hypothetical protein